MTSSNGVPPHREMTAPPISRTPANSVPGGGVVLVRSRRVGRRGGAAATVGFSPRHPTTLTGQRRPGARASRRSVVSSGAVISSARAT